MKYILYARKSSEQEDRQAMSIPAQINELSQMAEKLGFRIDKTYEEQMSAKKFGRPIFNEMLEYISKQKDCVVLAWKVDRLTRNIFDGAKIIELLENGNIKEIRTIDKVIMDNPIDKFMLSIDFGVGKKYSDDLSVNVKRGNRARLASGGWPSMAPLGYFNNKADKTIIIDPLRAPFICKMFELYVKGSHSINDIVKTLYEQGFRSRGGKRIYKNQVHRILINPFYSGIMVRDGKYYAGNHEPIISKQLFDDAQTALFGKTHSKKQKHFFPFRGFLRCKSCGCALTASTKKGHDYYYCTNGKGGCVEHKKYMRSEHLDMIIAKAFNNIWFSTKTIEAMYLASKEKLNLNEQYRTNALGNITKQLEFVAKKQSRLLDSHLADLITNEAYEAKTKELGNEETALKVQFKKTEKSFGNSISTLEPTKQIFLQANRAKNELLNGKNEKKREVLETLLWNLEIKDRELATVSYKMPYDTLAKSPKNGDFCTQLGR